MFSLPVLWECESRDVVVAHGVVIECLLPSADVRRSRCGGVHVFPAQCLHSLVAAASFGRVRRFIAFQYLGLSFAVETPDMPRATLFGLSSSSIWASSCRGSSRFVPRLRSTPAICDCCSLGSCRCDLIRVNFAIKISGSNVVCPLPLAMLVTSPTLSRQGLSRGANMLCYDLAGVALQGHTFARTSVMACLGLEAYHSKASFSWMQLWIPGYDAECGGSFVCIVSY